MRTIVKQVATVGAAGTASGSSEGFFNGERLAALELDYHASAPATTDVTTTCGGRTIFTRADSATDGVFIVARRCTTQRAR